MKGVGAVGGDVLGIAAQPPAKARARQVVRRPDRFPWRQIFAAYIRANAPIAGNPTSAASRSSSPLPRGASAGGPLGRQAETGPCPMLPRDAPRCASLANTLAAVNAAALFALDFGSNLRRMTPHCRGPGRCRALQRPGRLRDNSARGQHFSRRIDADGIDAGHQLFRGLRPPIGKDVAGQLLGARRSSFPAPSTVPPSSAPWPAPLPLRSRSRPRH